MEINWSKQRHRDVSFRFPPSKAFVLPPLDLLFPSHLKPPRLPYFSAQAALVPPWQRSDVGPAPENTAGNRNIGSSRRGGELMRLCGEHKNNDDGYRQEVFPDDFTFPVFRAIYHFGNFFRSINDFLGSPALLCLVGASVTVWFQSIAGRGDVKRQVSTIIQIVATA